jgi:HSP20 family molecular chaperone IbpA
MKVCFRPYVTFPSSVTMQVEFPSKHVPNRSVLPFKLNTTNDPSTRRIPIINSRDSSLIPDTSTYQFQPKRVTLKNIGRDRSNSPALSHITEEDSIRSSTPQSDTSNESSIFPSDFNSKAFYQSIFEPEIFTDGRHQRYIQLKLDVHEYNPDDIQVSINDNDLVVHVDKTNFYRQITLPSNIDAASLSIHHHHDKKLYITIKLLDEYSSIKYI